MRDNPGFHHRRSIRLKGYDYSGAGWYYVTVCTKSKKCLFGSIEKGKMILSASGKIIEEEWLRTKEIRQNVDLDYYVIMPNHIHGIIIIEYKIHNNDIQDKPDKSLQTRNKNNNAITLVGANCNSPLQNKLISPSHTLGAVIRGFKGSSTRKINELRNTAGSPIWQRNYYEHILRNETDLFFTRNYIHNNPLKWEIDELYFSNGE